MTSPTQRSLKLMRSRGYRAQVVERYNAYAKVRVDLFEIIDIVCVGRNETVGVQATSATNVSSRVNKIAEAEALADLRDAGWKLLVHGWKKVKGRWTVREVDVS